MENFDPNRNESTNFEPVQVEKKDGQDKLTLNEEQLNKIKQWVEEQKGIEDSDKSYFEARLDSLETTVSILNSDLDSLMDVDGWGFNDRGDVNIDDGQDTEYLEKVANDINSALTNALNEFKSSKEDMNSKIDNIFSKVEQGSEKWNNVQKLKDFIGKLEQRKEEGFTQKIGNSLAPGIANYRKKEQQAMNELLEGGTKVKF